MSKQKNDQPDVCSFPTDIEELKKLLTPEQFAITKQNGTERPFYNEYWDNHHPGVYVDVISKQALFLSKDKFDSGTGWPSFSKPVDESNVVEKKDSTHGMLRIEVRSKLSDSHLGHVFDDGPPELGGMRFCINSASLKFIPLEQMQAEGYEHLMEFFTESEIETAKKRPYSKP